MSEVKGMYESEYEDMILYVSDFKIGADAQVYHMDDDETMKGKVVALATTEHFWDDDEYEKCADDIRCGTIDNDVCGEFVMDDFIAYVGIEYIGGDIK